MNPISKALDEIKFRIPVQLLQLAFQRDEWDRFNNMISLDEQIRLKVINPRILVDCDLVGGQQITVPLDGLAPLSTDQYMTIFHIPAERLANRTIISVLSLGYMPYQVNFNVGTGNVAYATPNSMNSITQAAQRIGDSVSSIPVLANTHAEIIGHNTIMMREAYRMGHVYYLRCVVANDEMLNNIRLRSYLNFSKLCELAIKSYIYNKLIIRIDQAYLQGGQELGRVKEIVDSYSESEELYQTYLKENWMKVSFMNDSFAYTRMIKLMTSPGL